ncbi:hypothetical protein BVI2075_200051 [Burkholderia vietnamiensis]|nr:hypothetical protein BVI2075_200051 [Burkholderia vietnamiensis]
MPESAPAGVNRPALPRNNTC